MYGIFGQRTLTEWEVKWLVGYENSFPVRVGNAASEQLQLDVYGEVLAALFLTPEGPGEGISKDHSLLVNFVEHLETIWDMPDSGIWEVRGGPKHFTYSKVMAWLAFDRAVKIAERSKLDAPIEKWKGVRETIHMQICDKGFDKELNSFTQYYGSKELDASLLLLILVGFLPPEDARMRGTVEAVERHLLQDGLVMRYNPAESKDGLAGGEGMFLACSFWLVSSLCLIGRAEYARMLFEHLLSLANDVGLLSEEYDTRRNRLIGNFPQAFSHIALISAAYHLVPPPVKSKQES
jgi:GH15 family glucan-1,4-alpha-glucosidase